MRASFRNLFHDLDFAGFLRTRRSHAISVARWSVILVPMAVAVGTLCAAFLWSLDEATQARFDHPWLLFLLPLGGFAVGLLYLLLGKSVEGGNNLIVEEIHEPDGGVPLRMAPLIFLGTIVTHLFGGSAGREGTAVQMGGSLASAFGKMFGVEASGVRVLLMAGIAAGFGAVFGTPIAGAVFALEVLAVGRVEYAALVPCLLAAVIGDWTCQAWGIHHGLYRVDFLAGGAKALTVEPMLLAKVAVAGVAFGLVGLLFAEANHLLGGWLKRLVPYGTLRPVIGGLAVIGLVYALGTRDYLGLGVSAAGPGGLTITSFFGPDIHPWSWSLKILFTVVTLSTGFKGGEVTPLFFIGAALGNALAGLLGAPVDLFAALGFVAVFAGAANTPLACTLMGIELFGATHGVYLAVACFLAYLCSGHNGIYLSQRIAVPKTAMGLLGGATLREARTGRVPAVEPGLPPRVPAIEGAVMTQSHRIVATQTGMIRIYMRPKDRVGTGRTGWFSGGKPLYRELVAQAKAEGLINAVAHHAHHGYSNHGPVQDEGAESLNPELTMCVELIGGREQLERFCARRGGQLAGKVIVYKRLEHWTVGPITTGKGNETSPNAATVPFPRPGAI